MRRVTMDMRFSYRLLNMVVLSEHCLDLVAEQVRVR